MSSGPAGDESATSDGPTQTDAHLVVCQFCGCYIDEPRKPCPALDDGRCKP